MSLKRAFHLNIALLVALYMPLACLCATTTAAHAQGDQPTDTPAEHCHGDQPDQPAQNQNDRPCDSDQDCACLGHLTGPGEAMLTTPVLADHTTTQLTPLALPANMAPRSLIDDEAPTARDLDQRLDDRPRATYAPTLFSLSALLTT